MNKQDAYDFIVLVLEFDQTNGYQVKELARNKSSSPQITKILYKPECGLITACFKGQIELYDSIEFVSKGKWDNQVKVVSKKQEMNA